MFSIWYIQNSTAKTEYNSICVKGERVGIVRICSLSKHDHTCINSARCVHCIPRRSLRFKMHNNVFTGWLLFTRRLKHSCNCLTDFLKYILTTITNSMVPLSKWFWKSLQSCLRNQVAYWHSSRHQSAVFDSKFWCTIKITKNDSQ